MTADQMWQTASIVASIGALVFGAAWRLSTVLESVRTSVSSLKLEVQQDVAGVRSDVSLLRASVDGKLALAEAQTKAEIIALKATTERLDEAIAALQAPPRRPTRRGAA